MVSTRLMSTSGCNANASGEDMAAAAAAAVRPTVVTRQTSSSSNASSSSSTSSSSGSANATINVQTVMQPLVPANFRQQVIAATVGSNCALMPSTSAASMRQQQQQQATSANNMAQVAKVVANSETIQQRHLLELPTEVISHILSYMSYKEIGNLRQVSSVMNNICKHLLNSTFSKLISRTGQRFQAIKASMPRRESARRNHPLSCECDIIETCYMRLSLLQMTFGKHIERGHCCFFPGAILDEIFTILNHIKTSPRLQRPYRVTDELFDLSTMAMEYFRDHIESTLPEIGYFSKDFYNLNSTKRSNIPPVSDLSESASNSPPQSNMVLRTGIRKIKQGMRIYNNQLSVLRNELRTSKRKSAEQVKHIAELQKLVAEQQKQSVEFANRMDESDKKYEEMSRKFSTLLQELNKCKTELQYWRSKSPAIPPCNTCGQKMSPALPPEDLQALVNQGVKPEDIILNLNDDTDAESDISNSEHNLFLEAEFALPDQSTTAKLLAVNTATRNLKRQHTQVFGANNNNSTSKAVERSSNICYGAAAAVMEDKPSTSRHMQQQQQTSATTKETPIASAKHVDDAIFTSNQAGDNGNNNQTKQLAGNTLDYNALYGGMAHKGVIVSPTRRTTATAVSREQDNNSNGNTNATVTVNVEPQNALNSDSFINNARTTANVATLQAISSAAEIKKARRVQKATRFNNASGKRK